MTKKNEIGLGQTLIPLNILRVIQKDPDFPYDLLLSHLKFYLLFSHLSKCFS